MKAFIYRKPLLLSMCLAHLVFAQTPDIIINEFLASNAHINYDPDYKNYSDWFELYNNENYPVNLNGYYLTDDLTNPTKWKIANDITIEPYGYFIFWANGIDKIKHTNFKLNKDGEQIGLFSPDGDVLDAVTYAAQLTDISFGRKTDDKTEWLYYYIPTPLAINNTKGYADSTKCPPPYFSENSGFYTGDISLEITAESESEIRYTIDGSEPHNGSLKYTNSLLIQNRASEPGVFSEIPTNINPYSWFPVWSPPQEKVFKATVIRARTFHPNKLPSDIVTHTYFIDPNIFTKYNSIPVISLVSDQKHLFSDSAGIYVPGEYYNGNQGTGNYMKRWWRPAYIEYFGDNGELKFAQGVEIKTQGSSSKTSPQKSLHIIARSKYGKDSIDYSLFIDNDTNSKYLTSTKRFILRAWGSTWNQGMINDALAQKSYSNSSLDLQDYKPALVFINGEYWGLQEIREANKFPSYYEEHHRIDVNDPGIDLLVGGEDDYYVSEGDNFHWLNMMDFARVSDLSSNENFNYITTQVDIDNFIDYIGHCAYFAKLDWPLGNEALWRPRTASGRWKWIQYDMDTCFGKPDYNMFNHVFNGTNVRQPHVLLVELINNQLFKFKFINWFLDRINSDFKPEIVHNNYTEILDDIYPYLDEHQNRWAISKSNFSIFTAFIRNFISVRPDYIQSHLQTYFNLGELNSVIINGINNDGTVKINSLLLNEYTPGTSEGIYEWNGKYFEDVPITLTAIPDEGYVFDHWEGSLNSQSDSITFYLINNFWLAPVFSPMKKVESLYINEILVDNHSVNTDSAGEHDGWIELYNASNDTISLEGLYLTDDFSVRTKWKIPKNDTTSFIILPNKFKIIWCDNEPEEGQDHVGFSLNDVGGQLGLVQIAGIDTVYIDSVSYFQSSPNISYGRFPDASSNWQLLLTPTPESKNSHSPSIREFNNLPELLQNCPNPFNISTLIPLYLPDENKYTLSIFDIKGKLIQEFILNSSQSGHLSIIWRGFDSSGKSIPSGVYLYSLSTDKIIQTKKMLYIK